MLRVFKDFRLYCAHSVQSFGPEHKCSRVHGHCYRVRVEVQSKMHPRTCIAISFDDIETAWLKVAGHLDHSNLNDTFGPNATTEVLAEYLHKALCVELKSSIRLTVQETESSGVIVDG